MAQSIYLTSAEGHSGKSTIALGVLDSLSRATPRVGVFRAIARSTEERDYVLEMLLDHDGVDLGYDECIGATYDEVRADPDAALGRIVERYKAFGYTRFDIKPDEFAEYIQKETQIWGKIISDAKLKLD